MDYQNDVEDATTSFTFTVLPKDTRGAEPGDPRNCAIARAVNRSVAAVDVQFYRNILLVKHAPNEKYQRRQLGRGAKALARLLDKKRVGKDTLALLSQFVVEAKPPRPSRSLDYQRSAEWKARNAESKKRMKLGVSKRQKKHDFITNRPICGLV